MNVNYARMCYIFSNAIEKSLRYMPEIPETTIARYLLQWSLYEAKDIFTKGLPPREEGPKDDFHVKSDAPAAEFDHLFAADQQQFNDFETLIDYDYFDNPSEDLSGIDLKNFFPDDRPRKFRYRYGPRNNE